MTMIKKMKCILAVALSIIGAVLLSSDGFALSADGVYAELLANSLQHCYNSVQMKDTVSLKDFSSFGESALKNGRKQSLFYIPTGVGPGNSLKITEDDGTKIGCYELFNGDPKGSGTYGGKMKSIFDVFGKAAPAVDADNATILKGLGYTETVATGGKVHCVTITYTYDTHAVGVEYDGGSKPENRGTIGSVCWDEADLNEGKVRQDFPDEFGKVTSNTDDNPLGLWLSVSANAIEVGGTTSLASMNGVTSSSLNKKFDKTFFTVDTLYSAFNVNGTGLSGYSYNSNSDSTLETIVNVTSTVESSHTGLKKILIFPRLSSHRKNAVERKPESKPAAIALTIDHQILI